jgi:hypothetical protein
MTEEMVGGQHRNDEATRGLSESGGHESRLTTEKNPSSESASLRMHMGVLGGEEKRFKEV